jgi:hypothetical protein
LRIQVDWSLSKKMKWDRPFRVSKRYGITPV